MDSVTPIIDIADGKRGKYVVDFIIKEPKSFTLGVKVSLAYMPCIALFVVVVNAVSNFIRQFFRLA